MYGYLYELVPFGSEVLGEKERLPYVRKLLLSNRQWVWEEGCLPTKFDLTSWFAIYSLNLKDETFNINET